MEERGFDQLQTGYWPLVLIASTILLLLLIFAGGMYFRKKEMEWRAEHEPDGSKDRDDSASHPV
ncbi:MAG TPA: hypothetical protein VHE55_09175 [Fimbriimonadaceae bacterium]|nr:hypothetical protein [Fimbriimonadaceae bacterium]